MVATVVIHGDSTRSVTVDQGYNDTFHTAIGIHYQVAEKWLLTGVVDVTSFIQTM